MPTPLNLPYPPLVIIEAEKPLCWSEIESVHGGRLETGLSLCVRPYKGPESRGGYFFHIIRSGSGLVFSTFDRPVVLKVDSGDEAAAIINHASGLKYSETAWRTLQSANLRTDVS